MRALLGDDLIGKQDALTANMRGVEAGKHASHLIGAATTERAKRWLGSYARALTLEREKTVECLVL